MDRNTAIKVGVAVAALIGAAVLIFTQLGGSKPGASEDIVLEAAINQPVEQLKHTRLQWAQWLERAEADPNADPGKIEKSRANIEKIDAILREKGVDPEAITEDNVGPLPSRDD